jgi:hypothetical protein
VAVGLEVERRAQSVQWPVILAGAVCAAGISFSLHAFATGVGLSVYSTAPTWRDSAVGYWLLTGLYLLFVALTAFGVGGYITGRLRIPVADLASEEHEFRDGMHGLVTWAVAIVMTAVLALGVAAIASPAAVPSGGSAGTAQSVAGENIIASELDELFRTDRDIPNINYRRAEAARILLKSSSHDGVRERDRRYLSVITANATGISIEDAALRTDTQIAAVREELRRARVATVLQAFAVGVALFVGAAVAWLSASQGGQDRDRGTYPGWQWHRRRA